MGNGAQKLHCSRAETSQSLESDWCKLMAWAVVMALVCGGFGGVATARCMTKFGRRALHVGFRERVDEGNVAQNMAWAGADMCVEIPARLRVVKCASAAASAGTLAAVGEAAAEENLIACVSSVFVAALHEVCQFATGKSMGDVVIRDALAVGTIPELVGGGECLDAEADAGVVFKGLVG